MNSIMDDNVHKTIDKSIRTALLIDAFWERWFVHGVDADDLGQIRSRLTNLEAWIENWSCLANQKVNHAIWLERRKLVEDAELSYRTAALYYNLVQWVFPNQCEEKERWFNSCKDAFDKADSLSSIKTKYVSLGIDNNQCIGRIRIPDHLKGCIIIINPIDSSKDELFLYEKDFLDAGFATVSFDGPGQGETYVMNGLKASHSNWQEFTHKLIEYADFMFPKTPIFLFGTSFGASWVIYGSCHPKIKKAVAVSPAFDRKRMSMPDYFNERMNCIHIGQKDPFPDFNTLVYQNPVYLFHGSRDRMVRSSDIYQLYEKLPDGKQFTEYGEEMHCCNYKLKEIREIAIQWYMSE